MSSGATEKAGPGGRPTLYDPAYCERVIEMGKQGKSLVQIAVSLGVVRQTVRNWGDEHPEFLAALTRAREESQAWWEGMGQEGLVMQGFNASLWGKNVSCRFPDDWTDKTKQELSGPDGGPIPTTITVVGVPP
jgi:hypothetical protein